MDRTSTLGVRCSDKAAFGPLCRFMAGIAAAGLTATMAVAQPVVVWRCPGPPVLYTDRLSEHEAQLRRCTAVSDLPVAVGAAVGSPPTASSRAVPAAQATSLAGSVPARVDPAEQRSRDVQARRILEAELRREEERLAQARERSMASNSRTPPPPEQVEAMQRIEADIQAIRRELARLR